MLIGVALLVFGAVSFSSLLLRAEREIVHEAKMVAPTCVKTGTCFGSYELAIGNTGKTDLDGISAVIRVAPSKWPARHSVADLAADRPRRGEPAIESSASNDAYT